jgi:hypothetical protein
MQPSAHRPAAHLHQARSYPRDQGTALLRIDTDHGAAVAAGGDPMLPAMRKASPPNIFRRGDPAPGLLSATSRSVVSAARPLGEHIRLHSYDPGVFIAAVVQTWVVYVPARVAGQAGRPWRREHGVRDDQGFVSVTRYKIPRRKS